MTVGIESGLVHDCYWCGIISQKLRPCDCHEPILLGYADCDAGKLPGAANGLQICRAISFYKADPKDRLGR